MSDSLRVALADLSPRERRAMLEQANAAAVKWSGTLPRIAAVWSAYAELVADVDELAVARLRVSQ